MSCLCGDPTRSPGDILHTDQWCGDWSSLDSGHLMVMGCEHMKTRAAVIVPSDFGGISMPMVDRTGEVDQYADYGEGEYVANRPIAAGQLVTDADVERVTIAPKSAVGLYGCAELRQVEQGKRWAICAVGGEPIEYARQTETGALLQLHDWDRRLHEMKVPR